LGACRWLNGVGSRAPPCSRLWFCALWLDAAPLPARRSVAPVPAATPAPNRCFWRAFAPGSRPPPCGRLWFCAQWPDTAPLPAPRPVAPVPAETHAPNCLWGPAGGQIRCTTAALAGFCARKPPPAL